MPNLHFHGGGAYFHDTHSRTGAYDKHFLWSLAFQTDGLLGYAQNCQFVC